MNLEMHRTDDIFANVEWKATVLPTEADIAQGKAVLVRHMREKHPGKKYRIVREITPDRTHERILAVRLDG